MEAFIGRTKTDVTNRIKYQIAMSFQIMNENRIAGNFFTFARVAPFTTDKSLPFTDYMLSNKTGATNLQSFFFPSRGLSNNATNIFSRDTVVCNDRVVVSAFAASVLFGSNAFFRSLLHIDNNYGQFERKSARNKVDPFSFNFCASSALTGTATATLFTPFEMVRSQIILHQSMVVGGCGRFGLVAPISELSSHATPAAFSIRESFKESMIVILQQGYKGGLLSLYTGGSAVFAREILGNIAYFSTYEFAKSGLYKDLSYQKYGYNRNDKSSIIDHNDTLRILLAGGGAGMAYWSIALPLDNLKSFLQIQQRHFPLGTSIVLSGLNRFGVKNLFRGYVSCMLRAIPANAFLLFGYESALRNLPTK